MNGGQIGNVDLVKQLNSAAVYRLIDQQGPISRIQVADVSQLAPASVTKITRQLLERGLIKEVAQQASTGGRRAISLTTEVKPFHSVAVRLGRDYVQFCLYDLGGTALAQDQHDFRYTNQSDLQQGLTALLKDFISRSQDKIDQLIAIGITLPGLVNPTTGVVEYMPNTDIDKLALGEIIREKFGIECFVGNDVRGMALAEHYFGASQDCQDSILVSVHRGTGAGIIVNGQVFLGFNRNVGEIGHIQIDPLGEQCQCGNFGCLETVAANPAIIQRVKKLIAQGYESSLAKLDHITIQDVCNHALEGDELAQQSLVRVGNQLGKAIAITINLFNPQKIVIAGDITAAKDIVFPAIQRNVENQSLKTFHNQLPIVASQIDKQPTMGAFAMIKRAMLNGVLLQKLLGE
ncbi:ROK family protein [Vibrio vulnificus]|uniref:N-acetylglucosamine-6P-responsive transcriptional repressor NagC, ROK family n=2 Tax=Vibrio vulnificus TaxID=672 RepID=A0A087I4A1_VIBVL|nr:MULTISPECIES: ROK family protein [Vibrio]EWS68189.1 transcriptional regulator [Vibrio vulnificus BAA87]OJI60525.1 N-acetylglucosamine repressor [Vibrio fluvialis]ADV87239.1 N-acetylglucosamine-6P-responsive transcriptional repressor NagC, ROK family [Vibrio vulnificus MO6-24/O]AIL70027.1 N-acetylglucosamine repressor [Vibrio vulnificus]AMG11530.1 transcriptional regulator [Vibrio vulnificus]